MNKVLISNAFTTVYLQLIAETTDQIKQLLNHLREICPEQSEESLVDILAKEKLPTLSSPLTIPNGTMDDLSDVKCGLAKLVRDCIASTEFGDTSDPQAPIPSIDRPPVPADSFAPHSSPEKSCSVVERQPPQTVDESPSVTVSSNLIP